MYWWNYGGIYPYRVPMYGDDLPQASLDYWTRSLLQRMTALIQIDGAPQYPQQRYSWDIDALKYQLFIMGFAVVFRSKTYGVVPQPGTLTGYGLQYQPTGAMVATPYFQFDRPLVIGRECELIKLAPDYTGVFDICAKYATELRDMDISLKSAARNVRLGYLMVADSDKSAMSLKNIRQKIINGDDAIIDEKIAQKKPDGNRELPFYMFDREVRQNYILNDLLEARRDVLVDFYREIGVRMVDNKKERMITAEANAQQAETFIRSEVWADTLKESVRKVNEMFDLKLSITINRPDVFPEEAPEEVSTDVSE